MAEAESAVRRLQVRWAGGHWVALGCYGVAWGTVDGGSMDAGGCRRCLGAASCGGWGFVSAASA